MNDSFYMKMALQLAQKGLGQVSPNPMVGAVIVCRDKILSKGYHHRLGGAHAEIDALKKIHFKARGATLYCNLEPCCHQGRTPPCVDQIISSGIKKVVIAQKDPNQKMNGRSIRKLRREGIEVKVGVLGTEAKYLNRFFNTFHEQGRPFVILKAAMSQDGKVAPLKQRKGDRLIITGPEAHRRVHQLRAQVDAVVVGSQTVCLDDPQLNVRGLKKTLQPRRIVLDTHLKTPPTARLFFSTGGSLLLFAGPKADPKKIKRLNAKGAQIVPISLKKGRLDLKCFLKQLASMGIVSILVEGGAKVWESFLKENLVDEVVLFVNSQKLGAGFKKAFSKRHLKKFRLKNEIQYKSLQKNKSEEKSQDTEAYFIKK